MKKIVLCVAIVAVYFNSISAQSNWINRNPFEQKNFIENKGQIESGKLPNHEAILYLSEIDGITYYFTKTGYTISYSENVTKINKKEKEGQEEKLRFDKKEKQKKRNLISKQLKNFMN